MKNIWKEKPLHGTYPLITDNDDVDRATKYQWLSSTSLKREDEGFTLTPQYQIISTRVYQSRTLNNGADPNCKLWREGEETIDHIVLACPKTSFN